MRQRIKCPACVFGPTADPRFEKCYSYMSIKLVNQNLYYPDSKTAVVTTTKLMTTTKSRKLELIPNSACGMFNYGHSFFEAGQKLLRTNTPQKSTHPHGPVEFLHWHAIELFLKAFLLAAGLSEQELRNRPHGHDIQALSQEAIRRGLTPTEQDMAVLEFMPDAGAMIETRYLRTGAKTQPLMGEVEATCKSLYRLVSDALRSRSIPPRFYP